MSEAPPKRASWAPRVGLALLGTLALAGGALLGLDRATRGERELAAGRAARRRTGDLAERLAARGHDRDLDAALAALEVGEVASASLARLTEPRDLALVRLVPAKGKGLAVGSTLWTRQPTGELAATFRLEERTGPGEIERALLGALGDLAGVARKSVVVPWLGGTRVEGDQVHAPAAVGFYVASPAPVLLVLLVDRGEPVPDVVAHLSWMLRNHDAE